MTFRLSAQIVVACAVGVVLPACSGLRDESSIRFEIEQTLARQDAAWNTGDVEEFMDAYWRSPELTFCSGGRVTRGWQPTLEGYRTRYPDRAAMGRLSFTDLEITPLGDMAALVLGRWHLDRAEPVGGMFTLVMRKEDGRWVIIHDHTSRDSD